MYYVYVLYSKKDQGFYIGHTIDIKRRIYEHQNGEEKSTHWRRPLILIYYEAYIERQDAVGREKFLKSGPGRKYLKKQLKFFLDKNRVPV